MSCGAQTEAKQLNVSLTIQGPATWGVNNQTPIVNAVSASHPDAMIVVPNDSKAMIPPIQSAFNAGIKIVLADTTLSDTSFISSAVSSDNVALGAASADELVKLIGGKGGVLIEGAQPGVSTVDQRVQGFTDELKKYPGVTFLGAPLTTKSTTGDTEQLVAEIARHPDLAGVFSLAVDASEAAGAAIQQTHKEGAIKMVGFDTAPAEIQLLQKNVVQALIGQKPYDMGIQAVQQALLAIQGKTTQKVVGTGSVTVTLDNLQDPTVSKYIYKLQC